MGESYFDVNKKFQQKFIFYTALLTNPSCGKSQAVDVFKNAAKAVEEANNIQSSKTSIRNPVTVEALVEIMKNQSKILSFYDEASTFTGSLGRYNNGGVAFDRSVYLEMFNGPKEYNKDIKNVQTCLINPRINITLAGHPKIFIEQLNEEKSKLDDGLFHRFLLHTPKRLDVREESCQFSKEPRISMECIMYAIQQICLNKKVFKFNDEALKEYLVIANEFRDICTSADNIDDFIG